MRQRSAVKVNLKKPLNDEFPDRVEGQYAEDYRKVGLFVKAFRKFLGRSSLWLRNSSEVRVEQKERAAVS